MILFDWSLQYSDLPAYFYESTTHLSDEPKIFPIFGT